MPDELAVVAQPEQSVLAVISRAAQDPAVDVEKMGRLLEMQKDIMRVTAEREFKAALSAIQGIAPRVERDGKIIVKGQVRSTYATLEAVDGVLRPLTLEHGFAYRFSSTQVDPKNIIVLMIVSHRGGHEEQATYPLPVDNSEYRSGPQNSRASISFAKRCLICDFFNIITVGEDNDGTGGYITSEQALNIESLLSEIGAPIAGFLKFAEAKSIDKIPARDYKRCISALEAKRR